MGDTVKTKRSKRRRTADVDLGGKASRLSSIIFVLICFLPVFGTVVFGAVDNTTWLIISVFWAIIILLWLADAWLGGALLLNTSSLQLPLIGLLMLGLVQLLPLGGGVEGLSVGVSRALSLDPYSTRFFVTKLVVYVAFFAACLTFINNERRLRTVVLLLIVFGAAMAFYGILQRLASPDGIYGMRETPQSIPFGPFVNGHHFAAFLQMTGGLALALLLTKATTRDKKLLLAVPMVVMGMAVVLTGSRGGLLGFFAVGAFVLLLNFLSGTWSRVRGDESVSSDSWRRNVGLAGAGAALLLVVFGSVLLLGGNESLLRGIGADNAGGNLTSDRSHFWPIALRIFLEHPIIGSGLESFGVAFTQYDTRNGLFRVERAHNEYLQTLSDAGILGFACLAAFIYLLFKKSMTVIAASAPGFRRDAAIGALAGCFGILIHSFFDFPLRTPSNALVFLLICAIATVSITTAPDDRMRRN
ncbi:MAG TPA: O-antigen ligase family protein [Pyrinomonadaceae bacterium]|nr:O-antigen ligase family protein [Pyrinomonadaceae bacterium]